MCEPRGVRSVAFVTSPSHYIAPASVEDGLAAGPQLELHRIVSEDKAIAMPDSGFIFFIRKQAVSE